jgi:3-hydroxyacyl-CoA dehydrogenase, NAD binding domain/Thiolase, N-terminal domain
VPRIARDVVFVDGIRTPFGKAGPNGLYAETRADDMVVSVIRELLRRNPALPPERIGEVAIAATTQTGDQGLTIGRSAAVLAGLPKSVPGYAIDLVAAARDRTRDEGFAAEDEGLADLLLSDELQAGLYAFDLTQKRARKAVGAPDPSLARPVTKVGVVGAGLMAAQIALLFARRLEVPVVLTDLDQARLDAGVGHVHDEIAKLLSRGRITADAAAKLTGLVTGSLSKAAFADADFVIEAVFEEISVKQQVFAEVEALVRPDCVLATNTSSLSVTEMAAGLAHPERVADSISSTRSP